MWRLLEEMSTRHELEIEFGPNGATLRIRFMDGEQESAITALLDTYEEWLKQRNQQFTRLKL